MFREQAARPPHGALTTLEKLTSVSRLRTAKTTAGNIRFHAGVHRQQPAHYRLITRLENNSVRSKS